mmetsp:Transcript_50355/g.64546  ORF Transcript_50355/g.64546 Transcript_50355/m.64546 type:complete len:132 (+) Transcript_50355:2012-2407(+)
MPPWRKCSVRDTHGGCKTHIIKANEIIKKRTKTSSIGCVYVGGGGVSQLNYKPLLQLAALRLNTQTAHGEATRSIRHYHGPIQGCALPSGWMPAGELQMTRAAPHQQRRVLTLRVESRKEPQDQDAPTPKS